MTEALAFLGFMLAVLVLFAWLAILRVLRVQLSRPQKRKADGNAS